MRRIIIISLAAAAIVSCAFSGFPIKVGNGNAVETILDMGEFNALTSAGSMNVIYTQTPGNQSVTFTCDENLLEYYNIRVEDGTLIAGVKNGVNVSPKVKTILTVNSPVLNSVKVSGSGNCAINGPLTAEDSFRLKVSGSGNIQANGPIECKSFFATTSGSGDIGVKSITAEAAELKVSGSGAVDAGSISADSINARTSGSGNIHVECNDVGDIEARTSGSGSILLTGNARSLNASSFGSGKVNSNGLNISK